MLWSLSMSLHWEFGLTCHRVYAGRWLVTRSGFYYLQRFGSLRIFENGIGSLPLHCWSLSLPQHLGSGRNFPQYGCCLAHSGACSAGTCLILPRRLSLCRADGRYAWLGTTSHGARRHRRGAGTGTCAAERVYSYSAAGV